MVFEVLSADTALRTDDLGAWIAAAPQFAAGVACRFVDGTIPWSGGGLVPWCANGAASGRSPCGLALRVTTGRAHLLRFACGLISWFGNELVPRIGCELLARSFSRQQVLRARGTPSEAPAGPLSFPGAAGLSVPQYFRVRVGRHLI